MVLMLTHVNIDGVRVYNVLSMRHLHGTLWYEVAEMALGKLLAVRRNQRMLVFPVKTKITFGHKDYIRGGWFSESS